MKTISLFTTLAALVLNACSGTPGPTSHAPATALPGATAPPVDAASKGGDDPGDSWRGVPLGATVEKGLAFLVAAQGKDGGFGQDGRDPRSDVALEASGHDVANTAMVALALLRSGTTPTDGPHTDALLAAVGFTLSHVERAPIEGLAITDRQGTQIQRKLGRHVDTFLAAMLLAELRGQMPDTASERRVVDALDVVVDKIEKNQQADGSWNTNDGWAPILSTSLASRGLRAAMQKNVAVDSEVLARIDEFTHRQFDRRSGEFDVGSSDAGVPLYKVAQALEQASSNAAPTVAQREIAKAGGDLLDSSTFTAGFGSMGGEEFLSYMNISDGLARRQDERWPKWNTDIVARLSALQNQDGSWAGHHCITGRVACTAAAVLTLLAERTQPPAD